MGFTVCLQPKTRFARCPGLGIQWSKSIFNKFHDIDPAKPQTLNRIAFKEPWNLLLRESFRQFAILSVPVSGLNMRRNRKFGQNFGILLVLLAD